MYASIDLKSYNREIYLIKLLPQELYASKVFNRINTIFVVALILQDLYASMQSELPRPIPRNSVESDHGCTSSIYFDNAGDNVTMTLYKVALTSQKQS